MLRKLQEIRRADRATKLRWLIILSAISFVLVAGLWVVSIRMITANIENPEPATEQGIGLGSKFKSLLGEIGSRTSTAIGNLKNSIAGKEIELETGTTTLYESQ